MSRSRTELSKFTERTLRQLRSKQHRLTRNSSLNIWQSHSSFSSFIWGGVLSLSAETHSPQQPSKPCPQFEALIRASVTERSFGLERTNSAEGRLIKLNCTISTTHKDSSYGLDKRKYLEDQEDVFSFPTILLPLWIQTDGLLSHEMWSSSAAALSFNRDRAHSRNMLLQYFLSHIYILCSERRKFSQTKTQLNKNSPKNQPLQKKVSTVREDGDLRELSWDQVKISLKSCRWVSVIWRLLRMNWIECFSILVWGLICPRLKEITENDRN